MALEPASTTQLFQGATIVSYGRPPSGHCGVLAWGQVLNIRTSAGKAVEMVVGCPEMHDLPQPGQVCDISYEVRPPRVLVRWSDGRKSSTSDATPYPVLLKATCPPA